MSTKLNDPLGIVNPSNPTIVTAKAETARFEHGSNPEDCPVCLSENRANPTMKILSAGGIDAYTCLEHCVCLPVQN